MARKASSEPHPREAAIDALLALAAETPWDAITLPMIAERAGLSLADLRDIAPSKGAMLGGFIRRIDRTVLDGTPADMAEQEARDRVLDLMLRRLEALLPHRAALKSIRKGFQGNLLGLAALNQQALNSWRYLLASADIETEGPLGAMKLQGAIVVFARAFQTFLDDEDPALARTMAVLDRELKRGEWVLRQAEGMHRLFAPLRGFCRATREMRNQRRNPRERGEEAGAGI